jgi:GGDEF domain-containing protein
MRTAHPIPGWTERHSLVAVLGVVALCGAGVSLMEGPAEAGIVVGALAPTVVLGLAWDSWIGVVIGLGAAALVTFVRQTTGTWLPANFAPAALETAALVVTGWAAGRTGSLLRNSGWSSAHEVSDAPGAFGSIGMLSADLALVRLEEEVARATSYRRPLSLLLLDIDVIDETLADAARDEVVRATARVTETMLRDMDVPFLFAFHRMGAILPETNITAASVAAGRILETISTATFVDRDRAQRRGLADAATIDVVAVALGPLLPTAGELLDAAVAELQRS